MSVLCLSYSLSGSVQGRYIGGGFAAFGFLAFLGIRLLIRAIRDDRYDWLGHASASRVWFVVGGIFLQLPLAAWIALLIHSGWFQVAFSR